jgi:hypothetical protein
MSSLKKQFNCRTDRDDSLMTLICERVLSKWHYQHELPIPILVPIIYITAFDGTRRDDLSPAAMMQTQPLLRRNIASASTILTSKKPSMPLLPLRYIENAAHTPSVSQG